MAVIVLENQKTTKGTLTAYKIKRGDTLCSIAKEFNISIMSIFMVNKHKLPKQLSIGDTLTVPTKEIS